MPANFMPTSGVGLQPWGGEPPRVGQPYTYGSAAPKPVNNPMQRPPQPGGPPVRGGPMYPSGQGTPPGSILGSQTVRATGTGPFDSAYRQNLATYAGGQMQRPGGNLGFNPTSMNPFQGMGPGSGGGNAPIYGGPNSLLSGAFGGQGFSFTPQSTQQSTKPQTPYWQNPNWQQWLNQLTNQGGLLRGY